MHFQSNAYSIALLMSGVAALLVGIVLFQRQSKAIFWFALMMLVSALWAVCYSLELASLTLDQMLFWIRLEYIGISLLPAMWIMFVIHYIDRGEWLTRRTRTLIFTFPVVALALVWTNERHHIHYESAFVDNSGPFPLLAIRPGPWYHVHTAYFYSLMVAGMCLLIRRYTRTQRAYRQQIATVLLGANIPWLTNLIYLLGLRPHKHIDLTPYAFILTSLVIAFGLMRHRLFNVIPFAREKLIESIHEGMLVLDAQARVVDHNATLREFICEPSRSLVGLPLCELLANQPLIAELAGRQSDARGEVVFPSSTGLRACEANVTALHDQKKQWIGSLILFVDITERKRTTEELRSQAEQLQALNSLKNRLFSIIAHDLRSPLASLISILDFAGSETYSEARFKAILATLSRDVGQTADLLDNLLRWSKSQLEGERITPSMFDLRDVIETKIQLFQGRAAEKQVLLLADVAPGTMVFADRSMLELVVRNLVSNALKFCRPHDSVQITAKISTDNVEVRVRDTGVGMDETTRAGLFGLEVNSRPGTDNEQGTGLGLKLCRDFLEKNGGTIRAESVQDRGSIFYFTLPRPRA